MKAITLKSRLIRSQVPDPNPPPHQPDPSKPVIPPDIPANPGIPQEVPPTPNIPPQELPPRD